MQILNQTSKPVLYSKTRKAIDKNGNSILVNANNASTTVKSIPVSTLKAYSNINFTGHPLCIRHAVENKWGQEYSEAYNMTPKYILRDLEALRPLECKDELLRKRNGYNKDSGWCTFTLLEKLAGWESHTDLMIKRADEILAKYEEFSKPDSDLSEEDPKEIIELIKNVAGIKPLDVIFENLPAEKLKQILLSKTNGEYGNTVLDYLVETEDVSKINYVDC